MYLVDTTKSHRDVNLVSIKDDLYMAVACDSCGGVGEKEGDVVKVPPYIVGRFTCRVALMEILSIGSIPISVTAAICSEPDPTGKGILSGISDELGDLFLEIPVTISTEKNIPTCQTGLGITIIGLVEKEKLRINNTRPGDMLYCIGIPKVGNEVFLDDPEIPNTLLIKELLNIPNVHEIIPVGSKGIKGEAEMLASYYGLDIHWKDKPPIDIQKTAGPSTCILVTGPTGLEISQAQPVFLLAELK